MGSIWLGSLPDVLREAGLDVSTWPGWETRSRSSGGYEKLLGVGVHHDAIKTGTPLDTRCRAAWDSTGNPDRPVGAIWLHTDGRVVVGAAGATNTQGKGGPYPTSRGVIPLNDGNRYMLSIEASNNGVGEVWPPEQQAAYVTMCAALCTAYGLDPALDVIAHFEWTTRKIDPAGNSLYATGGNEWDMGRFRRDVEDAAAIPPIPPPGDQQEIDMIQLDLNPGTPWWTALLLGDVVMMHVVNGHHVNVMNRAGVPAVTINEVELDGILRSVATTNASPFAPGMPAFNQNLHNLWVAAAVPVVKVKAA